MTTAIVLAALAAFVAGFVDAIAGGGGIITLPALLFLGLDPAHAVATNKLVSTCGASAAAYTYAAKGCYAKDVVKLAMPYTAAGALLGAMAVAAAPAAMLKPIIAFIICLLAAYFWFKPELGVEATYAGLTKPMRMLTIISAFVIGFYDGFLGPGTGAFLTVVMVRGLGFDFLHAGGNTKLLNWCSNAVSLTLFLFNDQVLFKIALPMAVMNLLGGYLGAHTAIAKGSRWIRYIFLASALALVAKLIYDSVR